MTALSKQVSYEDLNIEFLSCDFQLDPVKLSFTYLPSILEKPCVLLKTSCPFLKFSKKILVFITVSPVLDDCISKSKEHFLTLS